MFYKKPNCFERVPLHWLLGRGIVDPPIWAKLVSWHHLTKCERIWFDGKYPSVEQIVGAKCQEWELNILRKLQTERDAERFKHEQELTLKLLT